MQRALAYAVAVLLAGGATSAHARAPLAFGVQDDPVLQRDPLGYPAASALLERASALQTTRSLGASFVKLTATWWRIERRRGRYDTARLADAVRAARAQGLRVQVMLTGPAPATASPARRISTIRPDPARFAAFAAAVASALGPDVEAYSVWNEPNWHGHLRPRRLAPRLYRGLYRAAFGVLRSTAPHARVLLGELAPLGRVEAADAPLPFLRQVLCRDRRLRPTRRCAALEADGLALHPYTLRWRPEFPGGPGDATTGSLGRVVSLLDRLHHRGTLRGQDGAPVALDLSEWGWHARSRTITEARRSQYALSGLAVICRESRVRSLVWYQLAAPPGPLRAEWDTALLTSDGTWRATATAWASRAPTVCPLATPEVP